MSIAKVSLVAKAKDGKKRKEEKKRSLAPLTEFVTFVCHKEVIYENLEEVQTFASWF